MHKKCWAQLSRLSLCANCHVSILVLCSPDTDSLMRRRNHPFRKTLGPISYVAEHCAFCVTKGAYNAINEEPIVHKIISPTGCVRAHHHHRCVRGDEGPVRFDIYDPIRCAVQFVWQSSSNVVVCGCWCTCTKSNGHLMSGMDIGSAGTSSASGDQYLPA